jgi:hypothetical protein
VIPLADERAGASKTSSSPALGPAIARVRPFVSELPEAPGRLLPDRLAVSFSTDWEGNIASLAAPFERIVMPMRERLGHSAIRPVQFAFGMGDCDPAVAGMLVITSIVREVMARPRVRPPRRFPGLSVNVELRHEFAAPLTKAIEPGDGLFAAHPVEDISGENFRNRAWITCSNRRSC